MYQLIIKCILPDNVVQPTSPKEGSGILGDDGTIENQIFELFKQAGMYEDALSFDENLAYDLGNSMLFRTPAIWSSQSKSVVRYAWAEQDLYTSAVQEFYRTHASQIVELEKLGCRMHEVSIDETDLDVNKLSRLCRDDCDITQFLLLMPAHVLETSPLLAEYYTKEISQNLESKEKLRLQELAQQAEREELERIQEAERLELKKKQETEQLEIANEQLRLTELENIRLSELAELEKTAQSQAELESRFNLMVQARLQAEQEVARLQAEYDEKINVLTSSLLPALKENPLSVLEVLESEINHLEIAHLAIAEAIMSDDSACELVIKSSNGLWSTNFIIMEAVIRKVTYNKNLAQLIRDVFPSDHLLIMMLNRVGA
jgi:hypothetical protein